MRHPTSDPISLWMWQPVPLYDDELPDAQVVDVCVVGAGISGLSVAYGLVTAGLTVTVVDRGPIGGGETARTSAHLASALDDRFHRLERLHGERGARLAAASHAAAIDAIEANVHTLGIDCGFQRVDGYLFIPPGADDAELRHELDAARHAGLTVERVERVPLPFDGGPGLRFADQAQFHPLAYVAGLARHIVDRGGRIYCGVHVSEVVEGITPAVHTRDGKKIVARAVVDATNSTITSMRKLPMRLATYRSYCIALEIPARTLATALYWDTENPYHYVRVARGDGVHDLVIVGGEDHRVGQEDHPERRWTRLERWARNRFPMSGAVVAHWSGQILEPSDGVAFIGKSPDLEHVFVCAGDSGNGLTHGAIAGLMIPALIRGQDHPWTELYDPSRSPLRAVGHFLRENANTVAQYADWLSAGDVLSVDEIRPGTGAVLRRGLHMVAAYRDELGQLHESSATCPHMKGLVAWNAAEQSWDCPCHGSRFDAFGRVLNGPAVSDLPQHDHTIAEPAPPPAVTPAPQAPPQAPTAAEQKK